MTDLGWDDVVARLAWLAQRPVRELPREGPAASFGRSAVLLLVCPVEGVPSLVLTRRGAGLRQDGGLIALPGGHVDGGESMETAALREAEEELGIDPAVVRVAGRLDDAWSKFGTVVGSVVGWCDPLPELRPAPGEVDEAIVVPLGDLRRPVRMEREVDGHRFTDEVLDLASCRVIGLTADLVLSLVDWLDDRPVDRFARRVALLEAVHRRRSGGSSRA
jgi:8-oxo-dGTP pyrophosphatase MutT (NUDIX family)